MLASGCTGLHCPVCREEAGKIALWFDWDLWYQGNLKTMQFTYGMSLVCVHGSLFHRVVFEHLRRTKGIIS